MPRYFFHISSRTEFFRDDEGVELEGLAAAHRCAIRVISRTMLCHSETHDWTGWRLRIADTKGDVLLTVLYPPHEWVMRGATGQRARGSHFRILCGAFCVFLFSASLSASVAACAAGERAPICSRQ